MCTASYVAAGEPHASLRATISQGGNPGASCTPGLPTCANGLHQLSASIVRRFLKIGIEDLHVEGMLGNRCLSRAIADMGFAELRQVVVIDRCYPSSKTCSCCGYKREALDLTIRQWTCPLNAECRMTATSMQQVI